PANRLAFLIDACEGEAREAIDHCTILEPEQGYQEAWKILGRRFGNPSVIARQHIASITAGPAITPNDASSLLKLADAMKACWLVLSQMNYSSELNTRTTMGAIINRLPSTIQSRWYDRASEILRKNREPHFVDLTDYIQDRADSLSVRESYLPSVSPPSTSRPERPRSFVTTPSPRFSTLMTASVANKPSNGEHSTTVTRPCLYCGKIHHLDQCPRFARLDTDSRATFVHSAVLCELCLKPRHSAKQCRSRRCCGLNGCEGLHHPLLHPPTQPSAKSARPTCQEECRSDLSVNCASGSCSRTTVALSVLPVTLRSPRGVCRDDALLDSSSDSTMLKEDVALTLGLSGLSTNISVATLNGQNEVSTTRVSFDIDTSPPAETPQSVEAWTVRQLPSITRTLPTKEQWSKWDHLKGIPFENAGSQPISLLIGMDVLMAHWMLESRKGKPHEPYANRTPLGWVLFGPINNTSDRLARINQLSSHVEDNLDSELEAMFDTEFQRPTIIQALRVAG
ncbi:NIMA (never in mitosis gene a)-related kinase 6, partial [Clonorchis sinensis]